jgi:hypothetical protein
VPVRQNGTDRVAAMMSRRFKKAIVASGWSLGGSRKP